MQGGVAQQQVGVEGVDVTYFQSGPRSKGRPTLVLIHGTGGSTDTHMAYLFAMLAFRQRVISIDLAQPAGDQLTVDQLVAQVEAVIADAVPNEDVSLLGYSLGAVIAAATAAQNKHVRNLVLVAGWMKTDAHQVWRNNVWRQLRASGTDALREFQLLMAGSPTFFNARDPRDVANIAKLLRFDEFGDRQMDLNARIDIADRMHKIGATSLIIGCTQDQMVPVHHSKLLFGAIEDARYAEIESGHAVMIERAAEVVKLVDNFLANPQRYPAGTRIPADRP